MSWCYRAGPVAFTIWRIRHSHLAGCERGIRSPGELADLTAGRTICARPSPISKPYGDPNLSTAGWYSAIPGAQIWQCVTPWIIPTELRLWLVLPATVYTRTVVCRRSMRHHDILRKILESFGSQAFTLHSTHHLSSGSMKPTCFADWPTATSA